VAVAVQDSTTGQWWDGTAFEQAAQTFVPASGTTTWTLNLAAAQLTSGHNYTVVAQASDTLGNTATSRPAGFGYNTSPPSVAVTSPANNAIYGANWSGSITGTAAANAGSLAGVAVAVQDTSTGQWWDGTGFNQATQTFVPVSSGTANWTLAFPAANLSSGHSYTVVAQASDTVGNSTATSPAGFAYNSNPPSVAVTSPANNATYGANWSGAIAGTAAAGAGLAGVAVAVQDSSTGQWWDGTAFEQAAQTFVSAAINAGSWSLNLPAANLTSGDGYSVVAQASDSLGNTGTSSPLGFAYNVGPPSVAVTSPATTATYGANWSGAITGSAAAHAGSLASVAVAVKDTSTGEWWDGTAFNQATQTFVPVSSGTSSWTLSFAAAQLTSGHSYTVVAQASDTVGNTATSSPVAFAYNTSPPSVAVTSPANSTSYGSNWSGSISGTAAANSGADLAGVAVALQDSTTGQWWDGTAFEQAAQTFGAVSSATTSWTLTFPAAQLTSGHSYTLVARATDTVGNTATSSPVGFVYNTSPPGVAVTSPANNATYGGNWTGAITGTAAAHAGSLAGVAVAVEDTSTGQWWDGTAFEQAAQTFAPVSSGTSSWTLTFPAAQLTSGHSYTVVAQATDSLGNTGTSSVSFAYNTSPPAVAVTSPANNASYGANWSGSITGTAAAIAGSLNSVGVAVQDSSTGQWWGGSAFDQPSQTFVPASGTTSWSLAFPAGNLSSGHSYTVVAQASDSLGNTGTTSPLSFSYSSGGPIVGITSPANGATYGANWSGAITGTAAANSGANLASVAVAVQDTTTGQWWSGTGFNQAAQTFVPVSSGTGNWTLTFPAAQLSSGHSYTVVAQASDSLGNTATSSLVGFAYNTAPLSVAVTSPANNGTYGTNWSGSITGTAAANAGSLAGVAVAVEDTSTGQWWDGTAFEQAAQTFVPVSSGTSNWSLAFPAAKLTTGHSYTVTAQATDTLGNTTTTAGTGFSFNTAPPSASLSYPANNGTYGANWSGSLTGTAAANSGGTLAGVAVAVEDTTTGLWWGGSAFNQATQTFVPVSSGTTSWSLAFPAANLTSGHSYTVVVQATDSLGNTATSSPAGFAYNASPPSVAVSSPANNGTYGANWSGSITGTAAAKSSGTLTSVGVAVQDTSTGQWWGGTGFNQAAQTFVPVTSGTTNWSLSLAATTLTSGHSYAVAARATDSLANTATSGTTAFAYNTTPPKLTLTSSGTNVSASGTMVLFKSGGSGSFTITASDPLGVSSTTFPAAPTGWTKTTATNSATYTLATATSSSTLNNVAATDTAGNTVTQSFTITNDASVTVTAVALANNGTANLPNTNDTATVTFSQPLNATTLCSAWTNGAAQSLTNATVSWTDNGSNDPFTVTSASCSAGGAFGRVASGANYIATGGSAVFSNSTVTWNPTAKTLTIQLGTLTSGSVQSGGVGKPGYTPGSGVMDVVGNSLSTSTFTSKPASSF
jgi:hypothetical protein